LCREAADLRPAPEIGDELLEALTNMEDAPAAAWLASSRSKYDLASFSIGMFRNRLVGPART
jgi:hypothetical protein